MNNDQYAGLIMDAQIPADLQLEPAWLRANGQRFSSVSLKSQVNSTNTECRNYFESTDSGCYLCIADQQQAGRGRLGRVWESPAEKNIYFSLLWKFTGSTKLDGLSLVVGMSIAQTLKQVGLDDIKVKWPNDLLVDGGKIGGVLIELLSSQPQAQGQSSESTQDISLIIGVGLNVNMVSDEVQIDQPWTSILQLLPELCLSRGQILQLILSDLILNLEQFSIAGWGFYQSKWKNVDVLLGKPVQICEGNQNIVGHAVGVGLDASLLVQVPSQPEPISIFAGDVCVRPLTSG